jgi:hypothetical protein
VSEWIKKLTGLQEKRNNGAIRDSTSSSSSLFHWIRAGTTGKDIPARHGQNMTNDLLAADDLSRASSPPLNEHFANAILDNVKPHTASVLAFVAGSLVPNLRSRKVLTVHCQPGGHGVWLRLHVQLISELCAIGLIDLPLSDKKITRKIANVTTTYELFVDENFKNFKTLLFSLGDCGLFVCAGQKQNQIYGTSTYLHEPCAGWSCVRLSVDDKTRCLQTLEFLREREGRIKLLCQPVTVPALKHAPAMQPSPKHAASSQEQNVCLHDAQEQDVCVHDEQEQNVCFHDDELDEPELMMDYLYSPSYSPSIDRLMKMLPSPATLLSPATMEGMFLESPDNDSPRKRPSKRLRLE